MRGTGKTATERESKYKEVVHMLELEQYKSSLSQLEESIREIEVSL